jgi:4-hydroxyproline epimerase
MSPTVRVIDSHTGGEPTRVVVSGGPDLGNGSIEARLKIFRESHDSFRSAVINEPRGSDILVGALLCKPVDPTCATGVIFFNNVGYLGMCGHGTIGLVATLQYLKQISPGAHRIETPVGVVTVQLHESGEVSVKNVPSYRHAKDVAIDVKGHGSFSGDIAWGGNWFFLVKQQRDDLTINNVERLTELTWKIRETLNERGITGADNGEIDHIELFGPPKNKNADSRNFMLCPGKAYDRSPCGTGTSAKLACLFADGKLRPGQLWRQESITGSVFECSIELCENMPGKMAVLPTVKGSAYVTGDNTLIFDPRDPLKLGIRN